jgi:hypothetical protein
MGGRASCCCEDPHGHGSDLFACHVATAISRQKTREGQLQHEHSIRDGLERVGSLVYTVRRRCTVFRVRRTEALYDVCALSRRGACACTAQAAALEGRIGSHGQ